MNTNKYEVCVIFRPNLVDDALKAEYDKVVALLEKFDVTIDKVDAWGKRKLAYEIDKVHDGHYYFFTIICESNVPAQIEKNLRINEAVLRYLIIKVEE